MFARRGKFGQYLQFLALILNYIGPASGYLTLDIIDLAPYIQMFVDPVFIFRVGTLTNPTVFLQTVETYHPILVVVVHTWPTRL